MMKAPGFGLCVLLTFAGSLPVEAVPFDPVFPLFRSTGIQITVGYEFTGSQFLGFDDNGEPIELLAFGLGTATGHSLATVHDGSISFNLLPVDVSADGSFVGDVLIGPVEAIRTDTGEVVPVDLEGISCAFCREGLLGTIILDTRDAFAFDAIGFKFTGSHLDEFAWEGSFHFFARRVPEPEVFFPLAGAMGVTALLGRLAIGFRRRS
jgi:hypothetical protein